MEKRPFPLERVYTLLGCGPVLLISSAARGKPNVMPIAWSVPLELNPPKVACCIGTHSYTHQIIKRTGEFVINIPDPKLCKTVCACGQVSGKSADKFSKFGLTALPGSRVKAPLVCECPVNLECRVVDTGLIKKYSLFVAEVVAV